MTYTLDNLHADLKHILTSVGVKYPEDVLKDTIKSRVGEDLIADAVDGGGRSTLTWDLKNWAADLTDDAERELDKENYPSNLRHKLEAKLLSDLLPKLLKLGPEEESVVDVNRLVERVMQGESPAVVYDSVVTEAPTQDQATEYKKLAQKYGGKREKWAGWRFPRNVADKVRAELKSRGWKWREMGTPEPDWVALILESVAEDRSQLTRQLAKYDHELRDFQQWVENPPLPPFPKFKQWYLSEFQPLPERDIKAIYDALVADEKWAKKHPYGGY